jgi:hypothetical protein
MSKRIVPIQGVQGAIHFKGALNTWALKFVRQETAEEKTHVSSLLPGINGLQRKSAQHKSLVLHEF